MVHSIGLYAPLLLEDLVEACKLRTANVPDPDVPQNLADDQDRLSNVFQVAALFTSRSWAMNSGTRVEKAINKAGLCVFRP